MICHRKRNGAVLGLCLGTGERAPLVLGVMDITSQDAPALVSKGTTLWHLLQLEKKRSIASEQPSPSTFTDENGKETLKASNTPGNINRDDGVSTTVVNNRPQSVASVPKLSLFLSPTPKADETATTKKSLEIELEETRAQRDDALAQLSRTQGWLKDLELEVHAVPLHPGCLTCFCLRPRILALYPSSERVLRAGILTAEE